MCLYTIHRSDGELLGPNHQYLPKIVAVFAEVYPLSILLLYTSKRFWFYFLYPLKMCLDQWRCRFYVPATNLQPSKLPVGWLIYWGSFSRLYHLRLLLQPGHPCSLSSNLHCSPSFHPSWIFFWCVCYPRPSEDIFLAYISQSGVSYTL